MIKGKTELINEMMEMIERKEGYFNLAISGGNSPLYLFEILRERYFNPFIWRRVRLFWVDERCVPPDDSESNYGNASNLLLKPLAIPPSNIFRIRGEENPSSESYRYSREVESLLEQKGGAPSFDLMILGVGEDGHTASIFPSQHHLLKGKDHYQESVNPITNQKRVTATGKTILAAERLMFYLNGEGKLPLIQMSLNNESVDRFPFLYILKNSLNASIFWDK